MAIAVNHARLIALCDRLAEATLAGGVEWRREDQDTYIWERKEGAVSIGARDHDGQPPYELSVFNSGGLKVEEIASALVENDLPADWNGPLAELYRIARRSALHADEIIEALMNALPVATERAFTTD